VGLTARDWAGSLAGSAWSGVSEREQSAARVLIIDAFGLAAAGRGAPGVDAALDALRADFGRGDVGLPFTGARSPAPAAAAALSMLIHAWDFDDTHDAAVVHTSCVALPAALAVAAAHRRTGADILCGLACGVQALVRLSAAIGGQRGMIRTAALGAIGAAAAAARALGLDEERFTAALGLALPATGSAMTRQVVAEGSPAKRLQPSLTVQAGVSAALLAARGVPGPAGWLTGDYGLLCLREGADQDALMAGITAPGWEVAELSLKPYPVCRYTHAAIAAVRGLSADGLISATVRVPRGPEYAMVARPFAWRGAAVADAQFSIPWLVAAALRTGTVDLATLTPAVLGDREIERLAGLVDVHQDLPDGTGMAPAEVTLRYAGGQVTHRHADMPGSPASPLSVAEVTAKAAACAAAGGQDQDVVRRISEFTAGMAAITPHEQTGEQL